jgi:hypothetical protein
MWLDSKRKCGVLITTRSGFVCSTSWPFFSGSNITCRCCDPNVVAFHAAKAAFIFKDGTDRQEYERALPDLVDYYTAIRRISDMPFDIPKTARLELEWWIVHRTRGAHEAGDLDAALAALSAEIYHMPAERFREHAKYRAEAMILRDELSEENGVTEGDWQKINQLLLQSWRSLWQVVNY